MKIEALVVNIAGQEMTLENVDTDDPNIRTLLGQAVRCVRIEIVTATAKAADALEHLGFPPQSPLLAGLDAEIIEKLNRDVNTLNPSVQLAGVLERGGIKKIWQLCQYTEEHLLRHPRLGGLRGFGRICLLEARELLESVNLRTGMSLDIYGPYLHGYRPFSG